MPGLEAPGARGFRAQSEARPSVHDTVRPCGTSSDRGPTRGSGLDPHREARRNGRSAHAHRPASRWARREDEQSACRRTAVSREPLSSLCSAAALCPYEHQRFHPVPDRSREISPPAGARMSLVPAQTAVLKFVQAAVGQQTFSEPGPTGASFGRRPPRRR